MDTYLLTRNPKKSAQSWQTFARDAEEWERTGVFSGRWSCGHTRRIRRGDRVFLLQQGAEPRGIMASGRVTRGSHENAHWNPAAGSSMAWYVYVRWDVLLDPDKCVLAKRDLPQGKAARKLWNSQSSGVSIPCEIAKDLERAWRRFLSERGMRDTSSSVARLLPDIVFWEGARRRAVSSGLERSASAKAVCLAANGRRCVVCGIDFGDFYGPIGAGFIEVHHLKPLSKGRRRTDPQRDLVPVCPNCHAMLHRGDRSLSVQWLRDHIRGRRRTRG